MRIALPLLMCTITGCGFVGLDLGVLDAGGADGASLDVAVDADGATSSDATGEVDGTVDVPCLGDCVLSATGSILTVGSRSIVFSANADRPASGRWVIGSSGPGGDGDGERAAWFDSLVSEDFTPGQFVANDLEPDTDYTLAVRFEVDGQQALWIDSARTMPSSVDRIVSTSGGDVAVMVIPPRVATPGGAPVLLFLHGWGARLADGTDLSTFRDQDGLTTLIDDDDPVMRSFPFLVVAPRCRADAFDCWGWGPTDAWIEVLDTVSADSGGDLARAFVTGLSTGGGGTFNMASAHPDRFVAAVPIASVLVGSVRDRIASAACPMRGVPVWAFHASADTLQPIANSEAYMSAYESCGPMETGVLSAGDWINGGQNHLGWNEAYRDMHPFSNDGFTSVWDWLLSF